MSTKYKAERVYWDDKKRCVVNYDDLHSYRQYSPKGLPEHLYCFDSRHEFRVWIELCRIYGEHRVLRQHRVEIIHPACCYPKGKVWKVDFAVASCHFPGTIQRYYEAKGYMTNEFCYTLALLENIDPLAFEKLYVVFPQSLPTDKRIIKNLMDSEYSNNLMTLKQLQKLGKDR